MFTICFADEQGNVVSSAHYGMPDMSMERLVTMTLAEVGDKTTMRMRHEGLPAGMKSELAEVMVWSKDSLRHQRPE